MLYWVAVVLGRKQIRAGRIGCGDLGESIRRAPEQQLVLKGSEMALSSALRYVDLTLECELCGFLMTRAGVWFWTASTFKCQKCKGQRRLSYSDKVALFAKHSHLA